VGRPPRQAHALRRVGVFLFPKGTTAVMINFMKTSLPLRQLLVGIVVLALAGCGSLQGVPKETAKPKPDKIKKLKKKNVSLEISGPKGEKRRVIINAYVCLRQGQLEQLLTRKRTKEHEAILAADVDARDIHAMLLGAGATPGSTVKFKKVGQ